MNESVSIIMANYNGSKYLDQAIKSVLDQTHDLWELIVVDDGSNDDSIELIESYKNKDNRIKLFTQPSNLGPAVARNIGLREAKGDWVVILDSDDLMDSGRVRNLIATAKSTGASIVADNMVVFYDDDDRRPYQFLKGSLGRRGGFVDTAEYITSLALYSRGNQLGFLKPIIRRSDLIQNNIEYSTYLKIGEDSDLILRCLTKGMKFYVSNDIGYIYRKRTSSISHRLNYNSVLDLINSLKNNTDINDNKILSKLALLVIKSHKLVLDFELAVSLLKKGNYKGFYEIIVKKPNILFLFRMPLISALRRIYINRRYFKNQEQKYERIILLISRQRIVGNTNGSSSYILSLVNGLRLAGYKVRLIQPSPIVFGRWPALYIRKEMSVFAAHSIRGGLKLGRIFLCLNFSTWVGLAVGVVRATFRRFGFRNEFFQDAPAPYAIGAPFSNDDFLYVARAAPKSPFLTITDYCFQNALIPYTLRSIASAVVMHDLFSSRNKNFSGEENSKLTDLTEAEEMKLLSLADIVIAIQADEASCVAGAVGSTQVVVAPMGVTSVGAPQPGEGNELLFVASSAAPNVIGLRWFLEEVWPRIRAEAPTAFVSIAGNISRAFDDRPEGLNFLGVVSDLQPLYARAAVVISPLTAGSGLKIKLIEGLAAGKPIVATPVTLQGVEAIVRGAVAEASSADDFAEAVIRFLTSEPLRCDYAARALSVAKTHFGVEASSRALIQAFHQRGL